jgi:hypothetical protein
MTRRSTLLEIGSLFSRPLSGLLGWWSGCLPSPLMMLYPALSNTKLVLLAASRVRYTVRGGDLPGVAFRH